MKKKAVSIRVVYDDGSEDTAEGKVADEVWSWFAGCQSFCCIHGWEYKGTKMTVKPAQPVGT